MRIAVIIGFVALSSSAAWATTGTCTGAPDGTPCVDECIDAGHCGGGVCLADHVAVDGTACSTGNFCTLGDTCQAGSCIAGTSQRVCPSAPDGCHVSACNPSVGCTLTLVCLDAGAPPDLESAPADLAPTAPPTGNDLALTSSADLATVPSDLATPPVDAAPVTPPPVTTSPSPDMAQAPVVGDMGVPDGGEATGPGAPVGSSPSPDMSLVNGTPGNAKSPYVHGSAIGCAVAGSGGATDVALVAVLLFTLLAPLRRRHARVRHSHHRRR